jgi:predicted amidohydrolase
MKITLVQSRGIMQDPTVNFFKARMRINNVESDIFVLPEMFCCGYTGDTNMMKIPSLDDKIIGKLSGLSVERGCAIIVGCPREIEGKIYDCALAISGKTITPYCKMMLGTDGAVDEPKTFSAGNRPMIIDHDGLKIGIAIGDDLLSPELYRFYAEHDCDLVICIAAFNEEQMRRFDKIVASRAAENSLPAMICNMVGPDCGQNLIGRSKYIGGDGEVIESCTESSDVRVISIDPQTLKDAKAARRTLPDLKLGEPILMESHTTEPVNVKHCPITGN